MSDRIATVGDMVRRLQALPQDAPIMMDIPRNRIPVFAHCVAVLQSSVTGPRVVITEQLR